MIRNRSPAKQRSYLSARVAVSTGILVDARPFSTSAGIPEMRLTGQRNVLLEGRVPREKFGGTIYLRITAALGRSIDQEIAHPSMTTGNPILRNLDRSRECWQRKCQKPDSTWIA